MKTFAFIFTFSWVALNASGVHCFIPSIITKTVPILSLRRSSYFQNPHERKDILRPLSPPPPLLSSVAIFVSGKVLLFSGKTNHNMDEDEIDDRMNEIRKLRVKELKAELTSAGLRVDDVFEKEELVKRVYGFRSQSQTTTTTRTTTSTSSTPSQQYTNPTNRSPSSLSPLVIPLTFQAMDNFRSVKTNNADVTIRPSAAGTFVSLQMTLLLLSNGKKSLNLLVDTACSGLVIRPIVAKLLSLPKLQTPVSMTAAGGGMASGSSDSGLTQVPTSIIGGQTFGPMPAAIQDIGALPQALDGIIGLSFLNNFGCVDFDFSSKRLLLYPKQQQQQQHQQNNPPIISKKELKPISMGTMKLTRLGIYCVDMMLDGRGPVTMLVDTGAASTFLDWTGVSQLNLSRNDSSFIISNGEDNDSMLGAVGADNNALRLTHRFVVSDHVRLILKSCHDNDKDDEGKNQISIKETWNIDIGVLPVLDMLRSEGVGGILGSDFFFLRCNVLRLNDLQSSNPKLILYQ